MENNTRIIIVDDHSLFREGIKLLVEKEGLGQVIAEAENGKVFLDMLEVLNPDVVLMDIEMPVMDGIEATRKAVSMRPDLKVLVLTMLSRKDNYTAMVNAGAMGFILKTSGKKELEKAIKAVTGGECYFSNELLRNIIQNMGKLQSGQIYSTHGGIEFTKKELEILQWLSKGLSTAEIAGKLFRSIKTIEAHRSKLLEKTNSKNTINLILYAIKNKLVEI
jgi:DNA-binding NarL/FixJ family response regulator